jgi:hypothetical protein
MAAILTYLDLQNKFLRSLDEAGTTGTTQSIAQDYIQSAQAARCTQDDWPFMLWPQVETFTTSTSTRIYTLHQEYLKGLWFRNRTTKVLLTETPFRTIESTGADWNNDSASADRFILTTRSQVQAQPTADGTLVLVSTSASDVTGPTVIIRGMTANGMTTETLTANGTTNVTSTNTFKAGGILQITKTGTWVGRLTISAGSTTVLTLFATEYGRSYTQLELLAIPNGADVIEYKFFRQPNPLANDYDIPDVPAPFSEILLYDALLLYAGYNPVTANAVDRWKDQRDRIEKAMTTAYLDPQTIGSDVRYIRDLSGTLPSNSYIR